MPLDERGLPDFSFNLETGLSQDVRNQLAEAIGQQDEAILRVHEAIRQADAARMELLSVGALVNKLVDLVMPAVASLLAKHAQVGSTPSYDWKGDLLTGIGSIVTSPQSQWSAQIASTINRIVTGLKLPGRGELK